MIPIQVLGTGLIPRIGVLAPKREPFMADRMLIATIMSTPGLTVNFVNPETGATTQLTRKNMDRIIAKWTGYKKGAKVETKTSTVTPPAPEQKPTPPAPPVTPPAGNHQNNQNTTVTDEKKAPATETPAAATPAAQTEDKKEEAVKEEAKEDTKTSTPPAGQQNGNNQNKNKNNGGFKPVTQDDKKK
ncbi:MAG: hypothetical protein NC131_11085 [Roseburia sp.]|nr:hypothetical protein [Roseburia sp.]